jgi:hypothetical protein
VEVVRPLVLGRVEYGVLLHLAWILVFVFIFTALPVNLLSKKLVK